MIMHKKAQIDLSIVIVNYNTKDDLTLCLNSIFRCKTDYVFEVIVVDNASSDDSVQVVRSGFPQVKIIVMDYNSGFSRANNVGIKASDGEYVLLLNSDTLFFENTIQDFISQFSTLPNCVAAGCQLLNPDGTWQYSGGKVDKGFRWVTSIPYYGTLLGKILGKSDVINSPDKIEKVDWIIGAFLCIKREALNKVGLMDEEFFLYAEEMEFCHRLAKIGNLYLLNDIKIIHTLGASSDKAFEGSKNDRLLIHTPKEQQRVLSLLLFRYKSFGKFDAFMYLLHFILGGLIYCPLRSFVGFIRKKESKQIANEVKSYCKNLSVWIKHYRIMLREKPYLYKVL
jgi:GT2 family glycosyltransferase